MWPISEGEIEKSGKMEMGKEIKSEEELKEWKRMEGALYK